MNLDDVILQIKANTTLLNHDGAAQVAGAAELAQVVDKAWLQRPAAYVLATEDDAEGNVSMNGLDQTVTETVGVVVDLDNTADQRGQFASSQIDAARADLFRCLLNWRPPNSMANQGFAYRGGHLVQMDRERLHWQFNFILKIQITDADGWQPPSDPITDIKATLINPETDQPTGLTFQLTNQESTPS